MLVNDVINFCDADYKSQNTILVCKKCEHEDGCSGSCKKCLEEIHYPTKYPYGKKDYDCRNLINFYVCDYSYKYASEIWYLLRQCKAIDNIEKYHIISIGCGGCPDLMAFESYLNEQNSTKQILYFGIDINELWYPIHSVIKKYKSKNIKKEPIFEYGNAIKFFSEKNIKAANVLILQYVISHFYNNNGINEIEQFFDSLIDNIILHKTEGNPLVVIINDVNSNKRGRDYFIDLCINLKRKGLDGTYSRYYFDYRIQNDFQRYGNKHKCNDILYTVPEKIDEYEPWRKCSSAQMLIEIK